MITTVIETERLVLRPLSLEHLSQDYVDWLNDPDVYRFMSSGGNYTQEMLNYYLIDVVKKNIYFWAIHLKHNDVHIGNIKIDPINAMLGAGEYGIMIGRKSEWGKGYAKEATLKIIDYCFNTICLKRVTLGVVADNSAAFNLYKSIGFEIESVMEKSHIYEGKQCDGIRMIINNPNFKDDK